MTITLLCKPVSRPLPGPLPMATEMDPRRSGQVLRSKGVLQQAGGV